MEPTAAHQLPTSIHAGLRTPTAVQRSPVTLSTDNVRDAQSRPLASLSKCFGKLEHQALPIRSEGQRMEWGLGLQGISRLTGDHKQQEGFVVDMGDPRRYVSGTTRTSCLTC